MDFIGSLKELDKYSNSTYLGKPITGVRLVKSAKYDRESGYLSETFEIVLYSGEELMVIFHPSYDVEEAQGGDYFLCAIQDNQGIDVQK